MLEAIVAATSLLAAATPPAAAIEERVQTRLVSVPMLLHERRPGGCEDLPAGVIEILEDGVSVGVTYLDPRPLGAMHALLVDAGPEMVDSLRVARSAALAYVDALPPEEPALLAAFDHRLLLHAPWSTNRQRFRSAADWIEPGAGSHLWEALRTLIHSFGTQPGRKVLIVLTRGCDTQSAGAATLQRTCSSRRRDTESLSIFPIGIAVPTRCKDSGVDPIPALRTLAERTGGEFRTVDDASRLGPALRSIRERIGSEQLRRLRPAALRGRVLATSLARASARWRKIDVRVRETVPCQIELAGPPFRCESAQGASGCHGLSDSQDVPGHPFVLSDRLTSLTGSVRDVIHDGGVVAPPLDVLLGSAPVVSKPGPRVATRVVSAWIPPVEAVVRDDASPVDVIVHALAHESRFEAHGGTRRGAPRPGHWSDAPFLVNGETLLRIRGSLARALAEHPDYLAWATERARTDRLAELDDDNPDRSCRRRARVARAREAGRSRERRSSSSRARWRASSARGSETCPRPACSRPERPGSPRSCSRPHVERTRRDSATHGPRSSACGTCSAAGFRQPATCGCSGGWCRDTTPIDRSSATTA